jgi:catechol 2,3-dioxygenase
MDSSSVTPIPAISARLPAATHIGRVRLRVADLDRAVRFYRDLLGLRVQRDEGSRVSLISAGADQTEGDSSASGHEIMELEERPGISRRPARPVTTGLYHVALLLPNRRELGRALLGLGQSGYQLRGMSDHGVSESLYLDDPDGNGLEIYSDRPRSRWPTRNGEILLAVEPMDVDGVLAAGRDSAEPWRGLPAETVVGHVHFTVSHMDRAVKFYRDVVGFDVTMRTPTLTAVSAGGYHHHLNLNTWAGEGAPRDSDHVAGLEGWELKVSGEQERRALLERLGAAGALTGEAATAVDPDGIPMEIEPAA